MLQTQWTTADRLQTNDYISGISAVADATASGTNSVEPETLVTTTELDMAEPVIQAEELIKGTVEPVPTEELRRFSAPNMEWDATR